MRFCPFCSAENATIATHCGTCARRLPPLPPRRRTNAEAEAEAGGQVGDEAGERPASAGDADEREPSLLARVAMGPASKRRRRTSEVRAPGEPARRETDRRADSSGFRGLRGPLEEGRGGPPAPSRAERDRVATERASREIPLPGQRPPSEAAAVQARQRSATPVPIPQSEAGNGPAPRPQTPAPRVETPAPRVETPAPRPRTPAPKKETPAPKKETPAPRSETPAPGTDPGARTTAAELDGLPDDAKTIQTNAAPPRAYDTEPVADDEWPAPDRPLKEADPNDWSAEANEVLDEVRPPPTPPPRRRVDSSRVTPARATEPPPTRIGSLEGYDAFKPPSVEPIPEVPESGLVNAARYALSFARARWQRRSIIKNLTVEIQEETSELDGILGALGKEARAAKVDNRVLSAENAAIDEAEARRHQFEQDCSDLAAKQAEEDGKFADVERERQSKVDEVEAALDKAQAELGGLEAQRRSLREKRKTVERQQKAYLKAADDRDDQAAKAAMGDSRAGLRRAAEDLRRDAAALDPERQDLDRRLSALEKPVSKAAAKVEALKAEHESARRSLNDAREGHRHRLAEIEAEQGRKGRELAQAEAEIQRRLVTLGTLVNLHRIERPEFDDMYARIDRLRAAIGARSTEIDRLTAEREAYDKASLIRGFLVLGGAVVAVLTLVVILLAVN